MSLIFEDRHIGPRKKDLEHMLKVIGLNSYDELIKQTFPDNIVFKEPLKLDDAISEHDFLRKLKKTAEKNHSLRSLIGLGYYGTDVPAVVSRNVFENPSWYTSYTPYQSEISQGRLEALINFQTMISSLTGFPMSNSSMLDDATAAGEAMRMMFELRSRKDKKAGKNIFFVDDEIFPHVFSVMETRAKGLDIKIIKGSYKDIIKNGFDSMCFGALVQYPAANGEIRDYSDFTALAHENGILVGAYCDILALAIYKEPAAWGADIAVGSAQRFGLPLGFGGPAAGWMTTTDKYKRNIPGRIIGESISRLGQPAYRLALQTREQHIKRDKATSNICTSTALMAVMSSMYAVYNGPKEIASRARKVAFYTNFLA
ncbi:MAG: glycine dehydrogenase (aminomethyl-transferring), partial [Bacteroidales bacterium]